MHSPDSVLLADGQLQQEPTYTRLLPELLLALLGHTGEVFVERKALLSGGEQHQAPEKCNFVVTDTSGLVTTSERYLSLLLAFCGICMRSTAAADCMCTGKHSMASSDWASITSTWQCLLTQTGTTPSSNPAACMYAHWQQAFLVSSRTKACKQSLPSSAGQNQHLPINFGAELLDVYRAAILQIQQHMLYHPSLTLAGLQHLLLECQVSQPTVQMVSTRSKSAPFCSKWLA